ELQRIVRKALTKDRNNRYQTSRDLLIDLKNLRRDIDLQSEIERSLAPSLSATGELTPPAVAHLIPSWRDSAAQTISGSVTTQDVHALHTSSAEYIVSEIKQHKTGAFIALVSILLLGVAMVYGSYRLIFRAQPTVAHFQNISMTKLTTLGN